MSTTTSFPDGFRWGTATAAHQVEGGNWNSDWWAWEHAPGTPCPEPSGDACDHLHRFDDDIALIADLGLGTYRFSLEWSRIEPEDNEFSMVALDHYKRMCESCRERGVEPMVTFHHFTSPRWVAAAGGWADPETPERFARFVERAASHLRDSMASACTINEPNWVATNGYILAMWPPGEEDIEKGKRASENFVVAHRRAVEAIRAAAPGVPVGLTLSMTDFQAVDGGEKRRDEIRRAMEDVYLEGTEGDDYIGVQTYTRILVDDKGLAPFPKGARLTLMGYEFYPDALEACIRRAVEVTGLPVIVTENGIGTENDDERIEYVERALEGVLRTIADGLDVRGYIYWSLLDNFEWAFGYKPTFGLVGVDRATQVRTRKPSAGWLGTVARANALSR